MAEQKGWFGRPSAWILAVVVFAGLVRCSFVSWDQHHFFHPDERAIAEAVQRISLGWSDFRLDPKFFAYGSLPFYLTRAVVDALAHVAPHLASYDGIIATGRVVSGVAGTLTVVVLILLGARLYNLSVGILAGFLLAACPLHVQNSHFMATDIALTLAVLVALFAQINLVRSGRLLDAVWVGVTLGIALACKFSALPLLAPLAVTLAIRARTDGFGRIALYAPLILLIAVGVFAIGEPYAFATFNPIALVTLFVQAMPRALAVIRSTDPELHGVRGAVEVLFRAISAPAYASSILEQSHMVSNAGLLPYTNQYVGTPKYGYELTQIVLWCMAPPLGLAAVWATGRRAVNFWRERSEEIVLLAWVVPFFLVSGWFEVKFIRYLLPIYPIMILFAAEWLVRLRARGGMVGRVLSLIVTVGTLLALFAFMSIYARPHTVVSASEWVYKFVPTGSKILSQDWDEGFPFSFPGMGPERYKITNFGYYEPDNPTKIRKLAGHLAESDYIAFQTKRLYGALTQAAQKYPLSSNYFYLLFAGDLGYTLVHEEASRPSVFGIEFPDELADESFTVYDHPKVLIFRNDGRLSADALYDKIMNGLPSRPMTRSDLLRARPGAEVGGALRPPIRSSLLATLTFALLVEVLGLAVYALGGGWLMGASPYALAKIIGVLLFAYVPWVLVHLGQVEFSRATLAVWALVLGGIGAAAALRTRRRATEWDVSPARGREIAATEILFWGTFVFFLLVRAFNPEVYWGEKPMDFSFLNILMRSTHLPPAEPWFAGSDLNYSYFGHYISAALGKLCHIDPAITFNLAIALFGGLTAAGAFALGHAISNRWRVGVVSAVLTVLLGNLAGPRELLQRHQMNFDYFWATSRVIRDTINEFPLWSFLFADLHAHVMVMPFSLAFLCLAVAWVRQRFGFDTEQRASAAAVIGLLGLTLGTIMVTNTWSLFTYMPFFAFLLGCHWIAGDAWRPPVAPPPAPEEIAPPEAPTPLDTRMTEVVPDPARDALRAALESVYPDEGTNNPDLAEIHPAPPAEPAVEPAAPSPPIVVRPRRGFFTFIAQFFTRVLFPAAAVVLLAYAFYLPYWWHWKAPERNLGWENGPFAKPSDFLTIFGVFLYVLVPYLFFVWRRQMLGRHATARTGIGWLRRIVLGLVILGVAGSLFVSTRAFLIILAVLALQLAMQRRTPMRHRIPLAMASFAFCVTAGCEVIYVWDRMNTLFKFYLDSWFLFAAAAAAAGAEIWRGRVVSGVMRRVWQVGFVAILGVAAFTAGSDVYGVLSTKRVVTPRPTLNGMLYLEDHAPYELAAYNWLNERISGIPVILEAYGPSYQEYTRVSMNTGLPTVLGWDYHVFQRAQTHADIERRKADIKLIYTSDNKEQVRAALQRYHVALMFIGPLERRTYPAINMEQLKSWNDLLTPVYENSAVTIFAVSGVFTGGIPVTTVEEVPRVTSEEAAPPPQEEKGTFHQPRGVALDSKGALYVCDFSNNRIQKLDPQLKVELAWGERGELPSQFKDPCGIAVGPQDMVYVADTWNQRVQVFTAAGQFVREWAGSFYGPRGIAVDARGSVFVADTGNHRIVRFSSKGDLEATWGGKGTEPGKFVEPIGIAVDGRGQVYVCDNVNARVQIFNRDGGFIGTFPVPGWEAQVYSEPYIGVDPKGTIWVTVPLVHEVRAYDAGGKLLRTITGQSIPQAFFDKPIGIAVNAASKQLYVADLEHQIVRIPYGDIR
ncbi:MAG TPA: DUF2298 domain-containing protein [Candidatus Binatia bacterium]|nr:DUF2298 domain-containing protein [Candidatus Binatia bacterium]